MEVGIEREIIVMKLIKHDNLLSLIDVYETKKVLYLIMEFVEGGELFDHLVACGRLEVDTARDYFRQIMFGVDHCHSFNICHRDLKPENLLLSKDKRQVKIADFGMAALQHSGRMLETSCGSPHYASPEIVSGKSYVGTATDIWSCGIILFALLCGRLPFDDPNMSSLLQKVKDGRFEMPRHLRDEAAKDLIRRMLVVDPRKRYTMREIFHHPWFTNFGRLSSTNPVPVVTDAGPIELPLLWEEDDIFRGLTFLFQGFTKEKLQAELCSPADTWPKRFYRLLLKNQLAAEEEEEEDDDEDLATASSTGSTGVQGMERISSGEPSTRPSSRGHHRAPSVASQHASTVNSSPNTSPAGPPQELRTPSVKAASSPLAPTSPLSSATGLPAHPNGVTPQAAGVAAEALASLQAYTARHASNRRPSLTSAPPVAPSAAAAIEAQRSVPTPTSPRQSTYTPLASNPAHVPAVTNASPIERPSSARRISTDSSVRSPAQRLRPGEAAQQDVAPSLPAVPHVGDNAAVQRFFHEVAAELALLRAQGGDTERTDRLQAKIEQAQSGAWRSSAASTPTPDQARSMQTSSALPTSPVAAVGPLPSGRTREEKPVSAATPASSTLSVPPSPAYGSAALNGLGRRPSASSANSRCPSGGTTPRSERFQDADEDETAPELAEAVADAGSYIFSGRTSVLSAHESTPAGTSPAPTACSPGPGSALGLGLPSQAQSTEGRPQSGAAWESSRLSSGSTAMSTASTTTSGATTAPSTSKSATNSPYTPLSPGLAALPPLTFNPTTEGDFGLSFNALINKDSSPAPESTVGAKSSVPDLTLAPRMSDTPPMNSSALPPLQTNSSRLSSRRATARPSNGYGSPTVNHPTLETNPLLRASSAGQDGQGQANPFHGGSLGRATGMGALTNALGLEPHPPAGSARPASRTHSRPASAAGLHATPPVVTSARAASADATPTLGSMATSAPKPKKKPSLTRLQQRNPGLALRLPGHKDDAAAASANPGPETPGIQSPRQASWFGSIFNWKPSSYTLYSSAGVAQTRQALLGLLPQVGSVNVVDSSVPRSSPAGSVFLRGTATGTKKAVKFRAELCPLLSRDSEEAAPAGAQARVKLFHERGSHATLKALHTSLREKWSLEPIH